MYQALRKSIDHLPFACGAALALAPFNLRLGLGPLYGNRRAEITAFHNFSSEEKRAFILNRVRAIVRFAAENVPFYRDLYSKHGVRANDLRRFEDLSTIPVVTREMLQSVPLEHRSSGCWDRHLANTGGTSGQPLTFYLQSRSAAHEWAHMHTIWGRIGFKPSDLRLSFLGRNLREGIDYNAAGHHYILDVCQPFQSTSERLRALLQTRTFPYLHGYPSAIYEFALFCEREAADLKEAIGRNLKGVLLGSEYPLPLYREKIEQVFGTRCVSWYGHSERAVLAGENGVRGVYEPMHTYGYVETVPVPEGGESRLLGTSYSNFASPFIRYDTGDLVASRSNSSGLITEFEIQSGRNGDFIIDAARRRIPLTGLIFGRHHAIFECAKFVQVLQTQPGKAVIAVVPRDGIVLDSAKVRAMFDMSNAELALDFLVRQEAFRTEAGKVPLLVSASVAEKVILTCRSSNQLSSQLDRPLEYPGAVNDSGSHLAFTIGLRHSLYLYLPARGQDLVCSMYGYRLARRRYGGPYEKLEQTVFARERWTREQIDRFASARLRRIVQHAAATVPYYRRLFAELKLDPREIREPADLSALPVLTKGTVQERIAEFQTEQMSRLTCSMAHTSGTTGAGLIFPFSIDAEREQWAIWWRYRARFGLDRNTWYAHFYGKTIMHPDRTSPPFWRVNNAGRQILFSAHHMSPDFLPYYVDELNRRQPPWIQGYPSLLVLLASFLRDTGRKLSYQPRVVSVGAESLLAHQKALIETAFGCSCRQHYGLTEGVANISECPRGCLHVDEDYGYVEFLPSPNGTLRIVGTTYTNFAFPLIRYDTGDLAEVDLDGKCECGLPGRVVAAIDGRIEDYIMLRDGRQIGRLDHVFKDMTNVCEAQIAQDSLDELVFRIVRRPGYTTTDERKLLLEIHECLGNAIAIRIDYVPELKRTATGKLRFVESSLRKNQVGQAVQ